LRFFESLISGMDGTRFDRIDCFASWLFCAPVIVLHDTPLIVAELRLDDILDELAEELEKDIENDFHY
jgi:hypothetical protein